jgi:hypothetical protein
MDFRHKMKFHSRQTELQQIEDLTASIERTANLLSSFDTTTGSDLALAEALSKPGTGAVPHRPLSIALTKVDDLRRLCEWALTDLRPRRGPEPPKSLGWLVSELCGIWHRETGLAPTNHAMKSGNYTARPQSPCGRFVLAAVEAMQPPRAWIKDHMAFATALGARVITGPGGHLGRAVYMAMRRYISAHPPPGTRRGRPRAKSTL